MRPLTDLDPLRDWEQERAIYGLDMRLHPDRAFGGLFFVASRVDRRPMKVIASAYRPHAADGSFNPPWNHVSVSRPKRTPTWGEMDQVKNLFFYPHETVMQLHVPAESHISNHPFCLHLWQPALMEIPRPPDLMVGVKEIGELL